MTASRTKVKALPNAYNQCSRNVLCFGNISHRSPLIRARNTALYHIENQSTGQSHETWQLTSTVIRVFDARRTTSRSAIIKLMTIPISTFQTTERVNVMNIIAKSIHAPILALNTQIRCVLIQIMITYL